MSLTPALSVKKSNEGIAMCSEETSTEEREREKQDRKIRSVYQSNNEVSALGKQSGTAFRVDFILTDPQTQYANTQCINTHIPVRETENQGFL